MLKNLVCTLLQPRGNGELCRVLRIVGFVTLNSLIAGRAFAQSALRVGNDSVTIVNANLVIQSPTKSIVGFLYNEGNGRTSFRKLDLVNVGDSAIAIAGQDTLKFGGGLRAMSGKSIQFKTGVTPGYPVAGAQTYTHDDFKNRNVKVWRNGVFQYRDSADGILSDSILGKVTFFPPLVTNDRIYVEAIGGLDLVAIIPPAPVVNLLAKLAAGVFYTSETEFTLKWATNNNTLSTSPKIVGLGSSTLAGYGHVFPNRLGDKIIAWLGLNSTAATFINLAVGGYKSTNLLPTVLGGTPGQNIDSALNTNPDFIFVALPSNDAADGITIAQFMANLRMIDTMASNRGIPVFFETTQPRTQLAAANQTVLKIMADSVRKAWPARYVEGFSSIVDNTAATDAVIKPSYDNGDGIHLTSAGNQLIADSLFARWNDYFKPIGGISSYIIDTSNNQTTWAQYDQVTGPNVAKKTYTKTGSNPLYFRIRAVFNNGSFSPYSNVVRLYKQTTTTPPPATFDFRTLIDLGGDGIATRNGSGAIDGQLTASPDASGKYWNNFTGVGGVTGFTALSTLNNLVTTNNTATTMGISIIGNPQGTWPNGGQTSAINFAGVTTAAGDYPVSAVKDNMFLESSINPNGIIMRINGLKSGNTYSIKIWGSRLEDRNDQRTLEAKLSTEDWSVAKSVYTEYSSSNPDFNRAIIFSGITGKESVDINLRVGPGNQFAHISVVDIGIIGTLP